MTSIKHRFTWSVAGNAIYAAGQWLTLVVIARLGDQTMLGRFSAGLALCAPVMLLTNLGLRNSVATDTRDQFDLADYLRVRALGGVVALVALAAILVVRRDAWPTLLVIALVGLSKLIESFSDLSYGVFQRHGRNDVFAHSLIIRSVLGLTGFVVALAAVGSFPLALILLCGSWLVVLVVHDQRRMRRLPHRPAGDVSRWRALVWSSLPLGVVSALVSLAINIPRYAVEDRLGHQALGVFTAVSYFLVVISVLIVALGQATLTSLSTLWAEGRRRDHARLLARLCLLCAGLGGLGLAGAALVGRPALSLVFGPDYADYQFLLVQTMAAAALFAVAGILGAGAMATRRFGLLMVPHLAAAAINLLVSFTFVRWWGLDGAGYALIASSALLLAPPLVVLIAAGREAP